MALTNETMVMLTPDPGKLLYADGVYSNRVFLGVRDTADRWVEVDIPAWWDADRGGSAGGAAGCGDTGERLICAAAEMDQEQDRIDTW